MLSAVGFDHELASKANEAGNIGPDWELAPKFCRAQASVAQKEPQLLLGIRRVAAHGTRPRCRKRRALVFHHPAPIPYRPPSPALASLGHPLPRGERVSAR